jgi:lipase
VHRFGPPDGRPVIALHGVTGHGGRLARVATEGLPELRVIAPDLRGHGRSTWMPPWNAARLATDIAELLDDEGIGQAAVMGHSYGGLLATLLAAAHPERVQRVCLLDPAIGLAAEDGFEAAEETRLDEGWATEAEAYEARTAGRPEQSLEMVRADVAEALERGEDGRYRLRYCRSAAATAWGEMTAPPVSLADWPGELLLVTAARNDYVDDRHRAWLRGDLGDRFREAPLDCDHMVYWDAFDELLETIRPFLVRG